MQGTVEQETIALTGLATLFAEDDKRSVFLTD